jgi:hypothetical protein
MAAHYTNIPLQDMLEFLEIHGFKKLNLPRSGEVVFGKRVDQDNLQLTLRVFTGIEIHSGHSRGVGEDAIRVHLFLRIPPTVRGEPPRIIPISGSKRVHRVENWRHNLAARISGWDDFPKHKCEKCGMPMTPRKGKNGAFLGCVAYPACTATKPIPET